ncbi:MAG: HPr(Ser) kinase/phosphatase [Saccharofermentans sp.]|jgi:HPr kinase/phosphorylase|nr:HPr(Ser) kinase/phosphatase [Mageeibacillus sp.]MCI1263515.1 HPr(Ser) kinase/phosphatase [Saccharofermentans sp.]MCI1275119.1 HPr(Ser) kinase/phosphatase [Saccharofermentans sp.]MCI2044147.1 HPr(Ser) kinase/phosphatase [Mageeibacillus sp.]
MPFSSVFLSEVVKAFDLEVVYDSGDIEQRRLQVADVTRPGLQLAGYYDHFGPDRIQLVGNMEHAYLDHLTPEERLASVSALFEKKIPALIITRDHKVHKEILEAAKANPTPILRTSEATSDFSSELVKYLKIELAPRVSMHGVLVEVNGEGILILGESGVGKSETALEIVKRGHRLIADDQIEIRKVSETTLVGRAPEIIRHLIEIRGIGILDVKELYGVSSVKPQEAIDFVINLELWDEKKTYDRLGLNDETTEILGIKVPSITIPVGPGRNLAIIVEAAAINYRVKKMGYNAAQDLVSRVFPGKKPEV